MDFSLIFHSILSFWYFIPFFIVLVVFKSAWFKGVFGEFIINVFAKWKLDNSVYHLIRNVTLPTEEGTTQIDHIIVSVYGVFVVETKNLKGWLFGSANQKTWTQQIYKHKSKFQNPLHQNYKHTKTLQSLLCLEDYQIHSVVVFIGDSTFKTEMPENVTYGMGYIRYILAKTDKVLNPTQVIDICQAIKAGRLTPSFKTNSEHVRHVQSIITVRNNQQICQKCGSEMVLRETKKGENAGKQFWGCSAFPKCRAIKQLA